MKLTWGSTITAGITASIAIILFMLIIPQFLGMGMVDLTRDMGLAFSTQSPHFAGGVFLAVFGILCATVFSMVYNVLPGNAMTKGAIYGFIVGLFSLAVLPNIMTTLDSMFGAPNQYLTSAFSINAQAIVTLIAYAVFGVILALSYRPTESSSNI